jgi:hypothetical protein
VSDTPSPDLATQLEEQRIEIADLHERVKALAAKRKDREALAQQVSDAAASDPLTARNLRDAKSAKVVDK